MKTTVRLQLLTYILCYLLRLQKTNIIRDYLEDINEIPKSRMFWPREIWSKYVNKLEVWLYTTGIYIKLNYFQKLENQFLHSPMKKHMSHEKYVVQINLSTHVNYS